MQVVNSQKEPYDVYIGSQSNRHFRVLLNKIPKYFTPEQKLKRFSNNLKIWLDDYPEAVESIIKLHNKTLGCDCGNLEHCHGLAILSEADFYWNKIYGACDANKKRRTD